MNKAAKIVAHYDHTRKAGRITAHAWVALMRVASHGKAGVRAAQLSREAGFTQNNYATLLERYITQGCVKKTNRAEPGLSGRVATYCITDLGRQLLGLQEEKE